MTDQELKDMVAGLAVSGERIDRQLELIAEANRLFQEKTERQMEKTERQFEKTERQMDKTERKLNKLCEQVGGIEHNNGYYSETYFQDVFEDNPEFGGIKYDKMIANFGRRDEEVKIEIDIVLINGDSLALIEVKYRIHPDFIAEFAGKRVKKFRELFPQYDKYKIYLGVAGFSFDDEVTEKAKIYGVGLIKPAGGDSVEVETECLKAY